jgi:hypothetical protein
MKIRRPIARSLRLAALAALIFAPITGAWAADDGPASSPIADYFAHWFDRVNAAQASQPHWITPLATTTPRLEQEFRYDQYWERLPHGGGHIDSFGAGKGLELIPTERTEIIVGVPPYMERAGKVDHGGLGDMPLLFKYRLLSENESRGNYIVTAFLQGGVPMGDRLFSAHHYSITPTIAFGKGWGDFDIQMTLGDNIPTGGADKLGHPIALNTAFQYHAWAVLWPEFEANYTYWPDGAKAGKSQLYLTPGIVFGRFPIADRLKLIVGVGYQFAVAPDNPGFDHNWILSVRTAF